MNVFRAVLFFVLAGYAISAPLRGDRESQCLELGCNLCKVVHGQVACTCLPGFVLKPNGKDCARKDSSTPKPLVPDASKGNEADSNGATSSSRVTTSSQGPLISGSTPKPLVPDASKGNEADANGATSSSRVTTSSQGPLISGSLPKALTPDASKEKDQVDKAGYSPSNKLSSTSPSSKLPAVSSSSPASTKKVGSFYVEELPTLATVAPLKETRKIEVELSHSSMSTTKSPINSAIEAVDMPPPGTTKTSCEDHGLMNSICPIEEYYCRRNGETFCWKTTYLKAGRFCIDPKCLKRYNDLEYRISTKLMNDRSYSLKFIDTGSKVTDASQNAFANIWNAIVNGLSYNLEKQKFEQSKNPAQPSGR